ncbi:MAG: MerR family transcriptional regulator [Desulfobacteraceae bacterium]|nr:MerR family transcriptional regulator [Desulfobacteraceae bacterium]
MVHVPDDKRYFRIGEASRIIGVEPYVLRYWESEFSQIRPQRADSNQRTYQKKDLETVLEIKRLLYQEKMTIEGAKQRLREGRAKKATVVDGRHLLDSLKKDLHEILKLLG